MTAADSELRRARAALLEAGDMLAEADRELVAIRTAIRSHRRITLSNQAARGADFNLWRVLERNDDDQ